MGYTPLTDDKNKKLKDIKKGILTFKFIQQNPKQSKSTISRYDKYKYSTNYNEFLELDGTTQDIRNDLQKGFIIIDDDDILPDNNQVSSLTSEILDVESNDNNDNDNDNNDNNDNDNNDNDNNDNDNEISDFKPKIIIGDVIEELKKMDDESIDIIITSPPYWGQRDYENINQWGNEETIDEYLNRMCDWANECNRVLSNEGTLFLNIGDKYGKKSLNMIPERLCIKMIENGWVLRNKIIWYKPNHQPSGVKDRFTNTWEYIYFFNKDSGKYYNYKYYQNIDCLRLEHKTESVSNPEFPNTLTIEEYQSGNFEQKINEYNNKKKYKGKYQDQDSINIGGSAGGRKSKGISYSKQRKKDITPKLKREIHEYLIMYYKKWKSENKNSSIDNILGYKDKAGHWFRTDPGGSLPKVEDWYKLKDIIKFNEKYDKIMTEEHYILQSVKNNPKGKNPGDIWEIQLEHSSEKHFAAFPLELPTKLIRAFCPPDGVVCDPFGGSGTTGLAAMKEKRNSIMIELNPEFANIMDKRFSQLN